MKLRPIVTEKDYDRALKVIAQAMDHESVDAASLDALVTLVQAYESKHYPIAPLPPVESIRMHMVNNDYRQADLALVLGSRSRATEILARKRPLTLDMVRKIKSAWGIPSDVLIQPYPLVRAATGRKKAA